MLRGWLWGYQEYHGLPRLLIRLISCTRHCFAQGTLTEKLSSHPTMRRPDWTLSTLSRFILRNQPDPGDQPEKNCWAYVRSIGLEWRACAQKPACMLWVNSGVHVTQKDFEIVQSPVSCQRTVRKNMSIKKLWNWVDIFCVYPYNKTQWNKKKKKKFWGGMIC